MFPRVVIQTEDFDVTGILSQLRAQDLRVGAVCSFVGTVRDTRLPCLRAAIASPKVMLGYTPVGLRQPPRRCHR